MTQGSSVLSLMLTIVPAAFTAGRFPPAFKVLPPACTGSHACVDVILGSASAPPAPFVPFLGPDSRYDEFPHAVFRSAVAASVIFLVHLNVRTGLLITFRNSVEILIGNAWEPYR